MIFEKRGKKINGTFTLGGDILEHTKSYTYLGIEYTQNGNFTAAKQNL